MCQLKSRARSHKYLEMGFHRHELYRALPAKAIPQQGDSKVCVSVYYIYIYIHMCVCGCVCLSVRACVRVSL